MVRTLVHYTVQTEEKEQKLNITTNPSQAKPDKTCSAVPQTFAKQTVSASCELTELTVVSYTNTLKCNVSPLLITVIFYC